MAKNTTKIIIKIQNDLSELAETTFNLSFDEMFAKFGDNEELYKIITQAQTYAKSEGLDESELYESEEEAEFDKEDVYDGSSKMDLINSDEKFQ